MPMLLSFYSSMLGLHWRLSRVFRRHTESRPLNGRFEALQFRQQTRFRRQHSQFHSFGEFLIERPLKPIDSADQAKFERRRRACDLTFRTANGFSSRINLLANAISHSAGFQTGHRAALQIKTSNASIKRSRA